MPRKDHTLRIIGGNWRSRKVSFPDVPGIRPTPDRVRETLFNWLQGSIAGARCLELYAGSGILSIEALSRGAHHASIIERDTRTALAIADSLKQLGADPGTFEIVTRAALTWTSSASGVFDIIFLDPPFDGSELEDVLAALPHLMAPGGLVYVESPDDIKSYRLPDGLSVYRDKRAGQVHFALLQHGR